MLLIIVYIRYDAAHAEDEFGRVKEDVALTIRLSVVCEKLPAARQNPC